MAVGLSAANTHDSTLFEQVIDAVPAILGPRGRPGRPRQRPAKLHADKRPAKLHADKGYDVPGCRLALRRGGITPRIARRGIESSTRLGRHRWKVERALAWLLANRRLTVRSAAPRRHPHGVAVCGLRPDLGPQASTMVNPLVA